MHWPLRASEVGVGLVSETVYGAVAADEAVSEFVFDAGAVRQPAFWALELLEAAVLMVLEGLAVVQCPLI